MASDEVLRRRVLGHADSIKLMAKVAEGVAEFGAVLQHVTMDVAEGGRLPFTYTVGLCAAGRPEVLVEALPRLRARPVLMRVVRMALAGELDLVPGPVTGLFAGGLEGWLLPVEDPQVVPMTTATAFVANMNALLEEQGEEADVEVSALQLVWPSKDGLWPWDEGWPYELAGRVTQPIWGTPPDM